MGRFLRKLLIVVLTLAAILPGGVVNARAAGDFPYQLVEGTYSPNEVLLRLKSNYAAVPMSAGVALFSSPAVNTFLGVEVEETEVLMELPVASPQGVIRLMSAASDRLMVITLKNSGEEAVKEAIQTLEQSPYIEYAEPNYYYQTMETRPDVKDYPSKQQGLKLANSEKAWDITTGSKSVKVGIIDTGALVTHNGLKGNIVDTKNVSTIKPANGNYSSNVTDTNGHGTHVAGIVGGCGERMTGVCWDVGLVILKVMDVNGEMSIASIVRGIDYAYDTDVDILNISLGAAGAGMDFQSLRTAINKVKNKILIVCAAGNKSDDAPECDNDKIPMYPAGYSSYKYYKPAASNYDNVVSVANLAEPNYNVLSPSSHYGENTVDLAAPGGAIYSTVKDSVNSYDYKSGTSMASPMVAGTAALMKAVNPSLTPAQMKEILCETSKKLSVLDENKTKSGGKLDIHAAVMRVAPNVSKNADFKVVKCVDKGDAVSFYVHNITGLGSVKLIAAKYHKNRLTNLNFETYEIDTGETERVEINVPLNYSLFMWDELTPILK